MNSISRRHVLGSLGLAAGSGLWFGFGGDLRSALQAEGNSEQGWKYTQLDPASTAADAYRLHADGGCMYGVFGAVVAELASKLGEPFRSFPLHMMRYGRGGVAAWGSLCGALNGGAALIGLVEPVQERQKRLVGELFSWYETTALPVYGPKGEENSPPVARSVSQSVLCHLSVHRWCEASGCEAESPEMKERCRRLSASVAAKVVGLLNANLQDKSTFVGLAPDVKACVSCHGKDDRADAFGTMRCNACHQLPKDHPDEQ